MEQMTCPIWNMQSTQIKTLQREIINFKLNHTCLHERNIRPKTKHVRNEIIYIVNNSQ